MCACYVVFRAIKCICTSPRNPIAEQSFDIVISPMAFPNIVSPRVSVITSLSYDHMAVLGNTLALIAGEKAGIIKDGVPVVSAPQKDEALEVLVRVASQKNADLTLVGKDVQVEPVSHSLDGQSFQLSTNLQPANLQPSNLLTFQLPLLGSHQIINAATAYAALKASGLEVPDEAIQAGFARVQWPARFEILRRNPPVVIDSAHNRESALRLRQTLDDYFLGLPVIMIFCALEDKDIAGMLAELKPRLERVVATRADHPRAPSAKWIAEQVQQAGIPVETATPASAALDRALDLAEKRKLVLTAGSVAFAGEIRAAWYKKSSL